MALVDKIIKTIKYARKFDGKITREQICMRLLSDKKYSKEEIDEAITNLKLKITSKKNNNLNNKKIELAKDLVKNHLSKFKNILMVGVTGSVAAENARNSEDIDLFLICKKNTMWLTRLSLRIYIKVHNIPHRKFDQKERPNDFCFNLWMDENNMVVPKGKQNQKNAVDVVMMKVIYNLDNVYEKFIEQNIWVKKYVANGYLQIIDNRAPRTEHREQKIDIIYKPLNYFAFIGQLLYIRLKGPVKFINLRQAFFHK